MGAVDYAGSPARVRKGLARHPIPVMVPESVVRENGYDRMRKRVVKFERVSSEQLGQLQRFIYILRKIAANAVNENQRGDPHSRATPLTAVCCSLPHVFGNLI